MATFANFATPTVKWGGATMTQDAPSSPQQTYNFDTFTDGVFNFYKVSPATGADTVKITGLTAANLAITVRAYTQVNTGSPGDPTSSVLQYCASGPDKFFLVTNANQTLTVFNSIGTSLSKLRVAK